MRLLRSLARRSALGVLGTLVLLVGAAFGAGALAPPTPASSPTPGLRLASSPLSLSQFSFSPNPVYAGSSTHLSVAWSGGTPSFRLWFNGTPAGCTPPNSPMVVSSTSVSENCTPSSAGQFSIHLDILDSSSPVEKASQSTPLSVQQSNGNGSNGNGSGNGKGGNGSGGLSLTSGFLQTAVLLVVVFYALLAVIAAGTLATAVLVSRRLRQLTEAVRASSAPPQGKSDPPRPP